MKQRGKTVRRTALEWHQGYARHRTSAPDDVSDASGRPAVAARITFFFGSLFEAFARGSERQGAIQTAIRAKDDDDNGAGDVC